LPGCKALIASVEANKDAHPGIGFSQGLCIGMVRALSDMGGSTDVKLSAFSGPGITRAIKENWHCLEIPAEATDGKKISLVVHYIEAQPQRKHEPFTSLALEAMFDAWACLD